MFLRGMAGAIFLLAFAARLVYLLQIRSNPFFDHPFVEAKMYDDLARQFVDGSLAGSGAFNQAPLYPVFLGLVYLLLGHDFFLARLIQVGIGALNCSLVAVLGRRVFNQRTGFIAGLAAAFYGPLIFYDAELQRPFLIIFFSLSALLALLTAAERPSPLRWTAAGLLLGCAAITWETILVFLPGVLLWMYGALKERKKAPAIVGSVACLSLAVAAVILPVTARNYRESGEIVLVSSWGGLNFYLGNNPSATWTTDIQPGEAWEDLVKLPDRTAGITSPALRSRWYYAETLRGIREQPLTWAGMLGKKLLLFWNAVEYEPNNDLSFYRSASSLFRAVYQPAWPVIIPFGVVGPLALAGMTLLPRRDQPSRLLLLFLLSSMVALVLYHVRARYRLPAIPVLILFAAWAVDRLVAGFPGAGRQSRRAAALCGLGALTFFVNADFFSQRAAAPFPLRTTLGKVYVKSGKLDLAVREFQAAIAADPGDYDAWVNLGVIRERQGQGAAALDAFQNAIRAKPDYAMAHNNLGVWLFARGRTDEAIVALRQAVLLQPNYASAHRNLGIAYAKAGRRSESEAEFDLASKLEQRGTEQAAGH